MNVVITGATKGIGRAIAYKFAENGFNIAVCARTAKDLDAIKQDLEKQFAGINVLTLQADVEKKNEVLAFSNLIRKEWKEVDVLVNNAGIFIPGLLHEDEEGVLEKQISINLYAAYYLTRELVHDMIKKKSGHIFNICSTASITAYPNGGSYCVSKFALLGMTKVLREQMKEYNIRVTAVMPGATFTGSWKGTDQPSGRFIKPEDVAGVVWNAYNMSDQTNVEEIVMRPILGDIL
ncbi:MAG TPA: SDR family oxidoreductase [bacterium]|nr:SDR family oxidoreductase [bacterium]